MKRYLFVFILYSLFSILYSAPVHAATFTVCAQGACDFSGAGGIQEAVEKAKDGDIILINGNFSGAIFTPFNGRNGVNSCFVDLKGKNLTLKGGTLFGDGHNIGRPSETAPGNENSPYYHRAGICLNGGKITIDGVRIKEFEGGGMEFINAQVIIKNSSIEGNDHGGIFLNNSSILAVNNFFVSNIGIIPSGLGGVQAYNNTFYSSKAYNGNCNQDLPTIDFVNNIVVDDELTIGLGWIYGNCPNTIAQFKTKHIVYNLIWKNNHQCYDNHEYCDNFTGKISADPKIGNGYNASVGPGGIDIGNLELPPDSPAVNAGDSSIPGVKNLGANGGPCENPNNAICSQFVASHQPAELLEPTDGPNPDSTPTPTLKPGQPTPKPKPTGNQSRSIIRQIINPYNLPEIFGKLINLPSNIRVSGERTTKVVGQGTGMDLMMYIMFSVTYILFMSLAIGMGSEFAVGLMVTFFVLGGILGGWFQIYEAGFVVAAILSLMFIGAPKKEM